MYSDFNYDEVVSPVAVIMITRCLYVMEDNSDISYSTMLIDGMAMIVC